MTRGRDIGMTLVVTNVSKVGIVMVGDSAETCQISTGVHYVRTGVRKVLPVCQISAGISMWGVGNIDDCPIDVWIETFIKTVQPTWTLRHLADELATSLNATGIYPGKKGDAVGGFHVAGYEDHTTASLPAIYHVHNKHPQEMAHELRVYHDFPESIYKGDFIKYQNDLSVGHVDWHIRNGAYEHFIFIWDALVGNPTTQNPASVLERMAQMGLHCPFPDTLAERARFYALLVEIVARLFSMSNSLETISLPLSVLTIDEKGIRDYQPALKRAASTISL
jgi:hypothetical protein